MRIIPKIFRAAALFAASLIACHAMAAGELVLGVQDYSKSPRMISLEYREMTKYLSDKLGRPVIVEPVQTYERFMERAKQNRYDIMFAPPSMVMEANALSGYQPVAKVPGMLSAAFMSLADGSIAFPEDMKGKRLGMPDENSLMTILAFSKLRDMKIDPKKYFSSVMVFNDANDVISALKLGMVEVGVANSGLFNVWSAQGHNLNLVLQSPGSPHLTFAVKGTMPVETRDKLVQALLNAGKDATLSKTYFKRTGFPGFEAASLKDYDSVKKLLAERKK